MNLETFVVIGLCAGAAAVVCSNNLVGLIVFLFGLAVFSSPAKADTFKFKYKTGLELSVEGKDYLEARSKASKTCFFKLTKGEFPGDEEGLEFIDICTNPLK